VVALPGRGRLAALTLSLLVAASGGSAAGQTAPHGRPAPPGVARELGEALVQAIQRLEAKDLEGVLTHVSDRYWTGPLTKPVLRGQLLALFQVYETLQARVRIDDVRLVGEHAWVYSTGEVSGRLPVVGSWMTLYAWERELEVARRESGVWRLYGYQQ
jgi:hypothetical protein